MKNIANKLSLAKGEVVSIIGSGGKTTLLWGLARHFAHKRVLVSTTTKIGWPRAGLCDSITGSAHLERLLPPASLAPGVHLAGTIHDFDENFHIKALPSSALAALIPGFDLCLLEADGSRNLPLKGWEAHEPVVPPFGSLTIGLTTVSCVGLPLDSACVHRPHVFARLAGAEVGEPITLEHIARVAAHPDGLFSKAVGRKIILINQLDDEAALEKARAFTALLPREFLEGLELVLGASLEWDLALELWRK